MLPEGTDPADVLVVMEPTRNAWVPLAAWFRRHGADVVLVPPERSADLRRYYSKHSKTDRLDSQLLAKLPMLHPDGLYTERGLGPGDALKRAAKLHSTLTHRRSQSLARLDALMELLGPAWHAAIGADLANRTPLKFLAAGYADPYVVKRLGRTRLTRFCYRHSRGAWGEPHAEALLAAASETLELWSGGELDYSDLAEDIAIEARVALQLTEEIKDLDERTTVLLKQTDPIGILTSAPGVAAITAAAILGRLGDPNRFNSLAGARSFTGLVPILDSSGLNGRHGGPTKRGDAVLRQALFMAAGQARRIDPTLAAKYQRLMIEAGKHHNSALCHIATTLLTRIIACWRAGQPYVLRDIDGTAVTIEQARAIITDRYTIPKDLRARRRTTAGTGTDRRSKKSQSAPSTGPSNPTVRPRKRLDIG
jgi:transposase